MALKKNQRIGPYLVIRVLPKGRGGFSQVLQARAANGMGEDIALKVARRTEGDGSPGSTTYDASLQNEVELLRRLHHRGIVRIVPIPLAQKRPIYIARDFNLPGHPWYFAMEYLEGGTLDDLVHRLRVLDPVLAIEVAAQVACALAYVHEQGVWHHDIKARNIMFRHPVHQGQPLEVVLGDFGVAQHERLMASVEGGSIEYLSPERLSELDSGGTYRSDDPKKADVYALGVVLYYMVTGRMPFRGSHARITTAIRSAQPESPLALNKALAQGPYRALDALIISMMSKDPDVRPTAQAVAEHLDRIAPLPREWHLQPARVHGSALRHAAPRWLRWAGIVLVTLTVSGLALWGVMGLALVEPAADASTATPTAARVEAVQIAGADQEGAAPTPTVPAATIAPTATPAATPSVGPTATLAERPTSAPTRAPALQASDPVLTAPVNDTNIGALPFELQWQARALVEGERFAVELRDTGGQTATHHTTATGLTLETWALAQNETVFWRVLIQSQVEGDVWTTLEESPEGRFVVALTSDATPDGTTETGSGSGAKDPTKPGVSAPDAPAPTQSSGVPAPTSLPPTSAPATPVPQPSKEPEDYP